MLGTSIADGAARGQLLNSLSNFSLVKASIFFRHMDMVGVRDIAAVGDATRTMPKRFCRHLENL